MIGGTVVAWRWWGCRGEAQDSAEGPAGGVRMRPPDAPHCHGRAFPAANTNADKF